MDNNQMLPPLDNQNAENSNQESKLQEKLQQQEKYDKAGINSLIWTLMPLIVFGLFYIVSGGSYSENDYGIVWFFFYALYLPFSLPITYICAVVFAIRGLKGKNKKCSVVAFIIQAIYIICAIKYFCF